MIQNFRYHDMMNSEPKNINLLHNSVSPASEHLDIPSATRVLRRFRVVFNAVKTHFRQVEKDVGVGGAQLWALSIVRDRPGIGVGELALAMDVHQSTASNLVKTLIERSLLSSSKNGSDRRTIALEVLPKGKDVLDKAATPFAGVLPDALSSLDVATLARLDADLGTLIAALGGADTQAENIPLADL